MRPREIKQSKASGPSVQTTWTELNSWRNIWRRRRKLLQPSLSKSLMTRGERGHQGCVIYLLFEMLFISVFCMERSQGCVLFCFCCRNESDEGDDSEKKKFQNQLSGEFPCQKFKYRQTQYSNLMHNKNLYTKHWISENFLVFISFTKESIFQLFCCISIPFLW